MQFVLVPEDIYGRRWQWCCVHSYNYPRVPTNCSHLYNLPTLLKTPTCYTLDMSFVRKTLKLNSLFFFIYFHPREPKHNSKCFQTDHGNNNSHTCNYSIVYAPVHVHPHSMIKYSKIYVT